LSILWTKLEGDIDFHARTGKIAELFAAPKKFLLLLSANLDDRGCFCDLDAADRSFGSGS
jgi:hypothetical protein